MKKICLIIIAVSLFLSIVSGRDVAKDPFKNLIHRIWDSDAGLPQNSIYCITQDSSGFMWFGTAEGLVKFDGFDFELFDKYSVPELKSNVILSVAETKDKCLWIGLRNGGLVKKCGNTFTAFSKDSGLTSMTVTSILENGDKIYFGTFAGGITIYSNGKFSPFEQNSLLPDSFIHQMAVSKDGTLYTATDKGLFAIKDRSVTKYSENEGLPESNIKSILIDSKDNLWVGTSDSGLVLFKDGVFKTFKKEDGLLSERVFGIEEDSLGRIWIGTVGGGINIFDKGAFFPFDKNDGLSSDVVRTLFNDRENNMWVGTFGGGVNQFRQGLFSSISTSDGLSGNVVFALLQDTDMNIIAGTYGNGLNILDKNGKIKVYDSSNGLSGDIPAAIYQDKAGNLWIGTYGTGLNIMDKSGKIKHFGAEEGLEMKSITSIFEDSSGTIYLGGFDNSLAVFKDGKFQTFTEEIILKNRNVWAIEQDADGTILLGTDGAGMIKMNGNKFTVINKDNGLSDDKITSIYRDSENNLWLGTYDSGINIIKSDGSISHIGKSDGLFDETIYVIVEDNLGTIWMSSNRGIFSASRKEMFSYSKTNSKKLNVKVYSWKDGMPSNECNGGFQKAGLKTVDGRLLFPTIKGIAVLDPSNTKIGTFITTPVISAVYIDGIKQENRATYSLKPGTIKVRIEYTAPSFTVPEKIKFRYRLAGFDDQWSEATSNRFAEVMNLDPGSYDFEVTVSDIEGNWNPKPVTIQFIQDPAFHQTIWFRALVLLLTGLSIFIPINMKLKKMKIANEELADIVTETEEQIKQISEELDSKYASSSLSEEDLQFYKEIIEKYMLANKPYLDNELTIRKLATLLEMQPHHLSQVINSSLNSNFYTFVNKYRIQEVIDLMKDPQRKHHTILAIAYDSGFKSKSSFNTIFKKMTGKTPSEYRDEIDKKV